MHRLITLARWSAYSLFSLSSLAVAAYAFSYLYRAYHADDPFAVQFAVSGLDVPLHMFCAGLALLLAPLQLAGAVRQRWPSLHRTAGWLYLAAVLIGGGSGLSLAFNAQGGLASGLGFALLSLVWVTVTLRGVVLAVGRDLASHRRWMCRSVALTYAAVTLRLMLGVGMGLELPFLTVYITAAWASWLLNLGVCELILRWPAWRARGVAGSRWVSGPTGA